MGHAISDAIKPELSDTASQEAPAFRRLADVSAILSALQLPSLCAAVLDDTGGQSIRRSRLSASPSLAVPCPKHQMPSSPTPRNAVNSSPTRTRLGSRPRHQPHNLIRATLLSRIMSGAVFQAMAGMLTASSANPKPRPIRNSSTVSAETGKILIQAIAAAPVAPNFFAQVATQMVQVSEAVNANYPAAIQARTKAIRSSRTRLRRWLSSTAPRSRRSRAAQSRRLAAKGSDTRDHGRSGKRPASRPSPTVLLMVLVEVSTLQS